MKRPKVLVRSHVIKIAFPAKLAAIIPADFYRTKIQTAEFYFERLLPRGSTHKTCALAPTRSVMQMDKENFAFD